MQMSSHTPTHTYAHKVGVGRGKRCRSLDSANEGKRQLATGKRRAAADSEETANTIRKANKPTSKQLVRQAEPNARNTRNAEARQQFGFLF